MTDIGFRKIEICEFLNCSPSELPERCKEITDGELISAYLNKKHEMEYDAWESVRR